MDLRPETRIAAEGMPVQFTVSVANYSASERKGVRVTVKVDGEDGSALGVMSQGELNCLALSLFLPRASMPE